MSIAKGPHLSAKFFISMMIQWSWAVSHYGLFSICMHACMRVRMHARYSSGMQKAFEPNEPACILVGINRQIDSKTRTFAGVIMLSAEHSFAILRQGDKGRNIMNACILNA